MLGRRKHLDLDEELPCFPGCGDRRDDIADCGASDADAMALEILAHGFDETRKVLAIVQESAQLDDVTEVAASALDNLPDVVERRASLKPNEDEVRGPDAPATTGATSSTASAAPCRPRACR